MTFRIEKLQPVGIAIIFIGTFVIDDDRICIAVRGMFLQPFIVSLGECPRDIVDCIRESS